MWGITNILSTFTRAEGGKLQISRTFNKGSFDQFRVPANVTTKMPKSRTCFRSADSNNVLLVIQWRSSKQSSFVIWQSIANARMIVQSWRWWPARTKAFQVSASITKRADASMKANQQRCLCLEIGAPNKETSKEFRVGRAITTVCWKLQRSNALRTRPKSPETKPINAIPYHAISKFAVFH